MGLHENVVSVFFSFPKRVAASEEVGRLVGIGKGVESRRKIWTNERLKFTPMHVTHANKDAGADKVSFATFEVGLEWFAGHSHG